MEALLLRATRIFIVERKFQKLTKSKPVVFSVVSLPHDGNNVALFISDGAENFSVSYKMSPWH